MAVLSMSDGELRRLEVLQDLGRRRLTPAAAGQLLGLERRQVFRLLKAYRIEGPTGLISKRRGRRSNRRKPEALRRAVLTIIRQWYWDFGPTLAAEKLRADHGIVVGRETLRQWMIADGLWRDRKQRKRVHQPRPRREYVGELVPSYRLVHVPGRPEKSTKALGCEGPESAGFSAHPVRAEALQVSCAVAMCEDSV